MNFNSFQYFLFLPTVFLLHYYSPERLRWTILLLASFAFYATLGAPHLILILLLVTSIAYTCGILIQKSTYDPAKLRIMWLGIIATLLVLAILKVLPKLIQSKFPINSGAASKTFLAIGTSYFIFQAISYIVDVYLEKISPEKHFGIFTLYMSFFPKLLQGPIERGEDLLPQLRQPYVFDYDNVRSGMVLFAWGLAKKIAVANHLACFTNSVFGNVQAHSGLSIILAVYFYAIQIYCDFSGYTDMARGTARLFNINLVNNFNNPYMAESIQDFWSRWHMSLSSWLQDYLFKPLQMQLRNTGKTGTTVALLVTFMICGLWHGATRCFLVWGLIHGIYISVSFLLNSYRSTSSSALDKKTVNFYKIVRIIVTFHLVALAWIPFRAASLSDAFYIVSHMHSYLPDQVASLASNGIYNRNLRIGDQIGWNLTANFVVLVVIAVGSILHRKYQEGGPVQSFSARWFFYSYILVALIMLGTNSSNNFIYMDF